MSKIPSESMIPRVAEIRCGVGVRVGVEIEESRKIQERMCAPQLWPIRKRHAGS